MNLTEKERAIIVNALTHHARELRDAAARELDGSRMHQAFTTDAEASERLSQRIEDLP